MYLITNCSRYSACIMVLPLNSPQLYWCPDWKKVPRQDFHIQWRRQAWPMTYIKLHGSVSVVIIYSKDFFIIVTGLCLLFGTNLDVCSCGNAVSQSTCIRHAQSHSHLWSTVNLWVATYSAIQHTYWSITVIAGIYIAMYLQYATSKNTNMCLGFSYPGQIQVWPRLLSPSFNTVLCVLSMMLNCLVTVIFVAVI